MGRLGLLETEEKTGKLGLTGSVGKLGLVDEPKESFLSKLNPIDFIVEGAIKPLARGVQTLPAMGANVFQTAIDNVRGISQRQLVQDRAIFGISKEEFAKRTPEQQERIDFNNKVVEKADKIIQTSETLKTNWIKNAQTGWEAADEEIFKGKFMENPSWTRTMALGFESAPILGMAAAITAVTKSPLAGATAIGVLEASGEQRAAREAGKTLKQSNAIFLADTIALSALETIPLTSWLKGKGGLKGAFKVGLQEGSEEVLQGYWTDIVAAVGYDEARKIGEDAVENFIGGFVSGGLLGTVGSAGETQARIDNAESKGVGEAVEAIRGAIGEQMVEKADEIEKIAIDESKKYEEWLKSKATPEEIAQAEKADKVPLHPAEEGKIAVKELEGKPFEGELPEPITKEGGEVIPLAVKKRGQPPKSEADLVKQGKWRSMVRKRRIAPPLNRDNWTKDEWKKGTKSLVKGGLPFDIFYKEAKGEYEGQIPAEDSDEMFRLLINQEPWSSQEVADTDAEMQEQADASKEENLELFNESLNKDREKVKQEKWDEEIDIEQEIEQLNEEDSVDGEVEGVEEVKEEVKEKTEVTKRQEDIIEEARKKILEEYLPALMAQAKQAGLALKEYLEQFTDYTKEQIRQLLDMASKIKIPTTVILGDIGEGKEKVRGLSKNIEKQAIEEGLAEEFEGLSTYTTRNMEDVAERASALMDRDYELAKKIALGQAPEQGDLRMQEMFTAIRIRAVAEGDIETIQELAYSETAASIATELGQRIKALDAQVTFDPVKTIQKIVKEREEVASKELSGKKDKEIADFKQKLDETEKRIKELEEQIESSKKKAKEKKPSGFGSKNKIFTQDRLEKARAALKDKLGGLHSGVDPTAVVELTEIGGFYLEGGIREFSAWSEMLVKEFGDIIKPHLNDIWKNVRKEYGKNQVEVAKEKIRGFTAPTLSELEGYDDIQGLKSAIQEIAEGLIASGVAGRNNIVQSVQDILREDFPDITYREVADLISGYGKYSKLNDDEVKVILRDIKGQLQQVSKLEDMQQGDSPLKTGVERRTPSDEERRLIKLVEDAKKKYDIKVTDPDTQLRSALDSYKTRLRNTIKDLEKQIQERRRFIKGKTSLRLDEEALELMARKTELRNAFNAIFGKTGLSPEQRIRMATRSLERSVAIYEEKISKGDISPITKKQTPVSTDKIEKLRVKRDVLQKQLKSLRDLAKPKKTRQEIGLQSLKTRLKNETQRLEDRLEALDFAVTEKRVIALDAEATKLKQKRDMIKNSYNAAKNAKQPLTKGEITQIVNMSKEASDAQKKVTDKDDWTADNAVEVEDYFDKRNKLEEYVESLRPKNIGDVVNKFIDYFRASILASPRILRNSFLYQIVPGIERTITKRIVTGAFSDADFKSGIIEKLLAKLSGIKPSGKSLDFVRRQVAMATRIYHNTGIDISRLDKMDSTPKFFGERVGKFQGKGALGKIAKFVSLAPKWLAGGTDMLFANIGRADTAIMMSKEIAKIEALQNRLPEGMTQEQRADQLLKDSYSFNPKDKRAVTIRDAGIMDAHMMNNTQPGWWSDKVIEFRRMLKIGKIHFGKALIPFAKIANVVVAEGFKTATGYGVAKSLYDINLASRKSNINDRAKMMRKATTDLVRYLGLIGAALILAAFLDDDDYIGAYNTIGRKEYELAKARNAGANYFRIGGKWIPARYFPMINIPMAAILSARQAKNNNKDPFSAYMVGIIGQILDAPGVKETSKILSRFNYAVRKDNFIDMAKSMGMDTEGLTYWAKVRMIPSVLSYDVWNALFPQDTRYDFMGREIERGSFKEDKSNDITLEFNRLSKKGFFPTISKPTGKYAVILEEELGEEEYSKMLSGYQKVYAEKVREEFDLYWYKKASNEEKMKRINKIRRKEILNKLEDEQERRNK